MSNTATDNTDEALFGEVIYCYTRAQSIEEGNLIDVCSMAREVGFKHPVALTAAVWADCVAWSDADSEKQVYQDQAGRLYDVLFMAANAIRTSKAAGDRLLYTLYRVPRDGHTTEAHRVTLKLIVGPGDQAELVMTVLQLDED